MKKLCTFLLFFFVLHTVNAQEMFGIANSNYAGTNGLSLNPSNFVENRNKLDINILTYGFSFDNDYIYFPKENIPAFGFGSMVDLAKNNGFTDVKNYNEKNKNFNMTSLVRGPSATFHVADHWFGVQTNLRFGLDLSNINYAIAKFGYEGKNPDQDNQGLHYKPLQEKEITADPFSIGTMLWREFAVTYGHRIYDKEKHFLKGAVTIKNLASFGSAWVRSDGFIFQVNENQGDTFPEVILITGPKVQYGHATTDQLEGTTFGDVFSNDLILGRGWGFDFGITYEYRPKYDEFRYEMDGQRIPDPTLNRYKWRVGLSVTDVGFVHFTKNTGQFDFRPADLYSWPGWDTVNLQNLVDFDIRNSINAFADATTSKVKNEYDVGLPRAVSMQVDYNIGKNFYANLTGIQRWKRNTPEITSVNMLALTPRFEKSWIEVAVPMSLYQYSQFRLGLMLRLASFVVGSDKFGSLMGLHDMGGMDVYTSLKFTLDRKKIKDRDGDGVSDKKDLCPKDRGPWATMGCPDRDRDGIADKDDECPDVAGLAIFRGCPDTDGDGIPDREDDCPDVPGLLVFKGCPDTDGDSIPDPKDDCPTLFGIPLFNGCPDTDSDGIIDPQDSCPTIAGLMQYNGCPDTDSDGIIDPQDSCPLVAGPRSNNGCPVIQKVEKQKEPAKVVLTQEEQEVINKVFKNLEFETAKAIIRSGSFESLNELAELMKKKTNFRLLIDGHTDNVGGKSYNQKLSQARADAVKKYLTDKGIASSRITAKGYGLSKPIATNKTPEGRQKNRRVEFTVVE